MRTRLLVLTIPLLLGACGSTEHKTVVITPPANSTTVVDADGHVHTVPN